MKAYLKVFRDAVIAAAILATAGLIINAARPDGLPFIADKPYDIFVPCPIIKGEITMIAPDDALIHDASSFVLDARSAEDFNVWHLDGAINVTYDYLDPIPPEELKNISMNIANSGKARVIVYGDGDGKNGSSGYEMGNELAGNGIKNVFVVEGGANALKGGKL